MEVEKMPVSIKEYFPSYRRKALILVSLFSLVSPIAMYLTLAFGFGKSSEITTYIYTFAAYVITWLVGFIIFQMASKPLADLLATVMHVAGEASDKPPVAPNEPKYEGTGFQTAVKSLYQLSSTDTTKEAPKSNLDLVSQALENTKAGFVVMNEGAIVYSNGAAPISIDTTGNKHLKLLFQETDSLDVWLANCRQNAVKSDKIWTRIPNTLPEEEDCRYFDVLASYNKESNYELVLSLIDRTAIYATTEEALNFISFAAHELRGPITVIKGYLDVLEDELTPVLQGDQAELFGRLKVSANRLTSYINNILNTSKFDRRHLKLNLAEDTVANVYDFIKDDMAMRAQTQKRILSVKIPVNLPTIAADRASLSEVFSNLIDNAIKYSKEGGQINLTARANGDRVEIAVQDFGIGMPQSVLSNLFQKFYRSHRSRETVAGTGIGLYISKAIVESHGGAINVSSQEGQGSVFTVSLPTYTVMAAKLASDKSSNAGIISQGSGWIKNHSLYRG